MQGALLGNEQDNPLHALYDKLSESALKLKTVVWGLLLLFPVDGEKQG